MLGRFISDSAIYAIPTVLSRGIGFLLLPLYTHNLSPAEYGVVELLVIAYAMLNLLLPLEIGQAVARLLPDAEIQKKILFASTSFWFTATVFTTFSIVVWLFPVQIGLLLFGDEKYVNILFLACLAMIANALFYLVQNQLRSNLQSRCSAIISVVFTLSMASVVVLLISVFNYGILGYIWGQLIGSTVGLLAGLYLTRTSVPISFDFDFEILREMLLFSMPLVLSSSAVYFSQFADRWMLRLLLDVDDVGIYAVAYRIASIMSLLVIVFQMALTPLVYKYYKESKTPSEIGRVFSYFMLMVAPLVALVSAFSSEIIGLISPSDYQDADELIPWLSLAVITMNVYIFAPGLAIAKKTKVIAMISISAMIVNVILNLIWVQQFGRVGAAYATLCGAIVMAVLYFLIGQKYYAVHYRKVECVLSVLILGAFQLIIGVFELSDLLKTLLLILLVILTASILVKPEEWRQVKNYLVRIM